MVKKCFDIIMFIVTGDNNVIHSQPQPACSRKHDIAKLPHFSFVRSEKIEKTPENSSHALVNWIWMSVITFLSAENYKNESLTPATVKLNQKYFFT